VAALVAFVTFLAVLGVLTLTRSERSAVPWDPDLVLDELPDVPDSAAPQQAIEASLVDASSSVHEGDAYRFKVRLRNPTSDDIALSPCPSYFMAVDDGSGGFATFARLPCERAPRIPAGDFVDFEMEIDPFPTDCCAVVWKLWEPTFNPPEGWASAPTCDHGNSTDRMCSDP
jgi:hypothetical protein